MPDASGGQGARKAESASNTISGNARHLVPDGSWESDFIDNTNTQAWFSFPIYSQHAYMIEAQVPFNYNNLSVTTLEIGVFESDGTTAVSTVDSYLMQPSLDENGFGGGARQNLINFSGGDRFLHIAVKACCSNPVPAAGISFHLRAIDLTQVAARWTVNGYNMFIALNNTSRDPVSGFVEYFDQAGTFVAFDTFSLAKDGSTQIVHNANLTVGGVLFGGIRVLPQSGSPGAITAYEYNFNAAIGQYLSFPFNPSPWRYGTPTQ